MQKRLVLPVVICACAIVLAALAYQRSVIDNSTPIVRHGYSAAEPARIASLAPNLTEILFALGLGSSVVAVSSDSDYPAEAAQRKKLGTFWQPNTEAVIAAEPDLVVGLAFAQQQAVARTLRRLGISVLTVKIETIADLFAAISEIGQAAGCRQEAEQLVGAIRAELDTLVSKLGSTDRPKVLWVIQLEPFRVASRNTFINELITLAGGENVVGSTSSRYPQVGTEQLLTCGAEVIIHPAMGNADIDRQRREVELFWAKLPGLAAVRNGRIYVVESDVLLRLGPRLCSGIETLARCLHPERFGAEQDEPAGGFVE